MDCPAFISFYITRDRKPLQIKEVELSHNDHEISKAFYKFLPEKRRLAPKEREVAMQNLELQCNKKLLRENLEDKYGKSVTMKDLTNINAQLRHDDDLTKMVQYLQNKGAVVKVLTESGKFKALFFSTVDMKRSMNAWSEVVFVDETYLLLRINLTVMILVVEDSNAPTGIVGKGLLAKEDYTIFKWFLLRKKTHRPANESITLWQIRIFWSEMFLRKYFLAYRCTYAFFTV